MLVVGRAVVDRAVSSNRRQMSDVPLWQMWQVWQVCVVVVVCGGVWWRCVVYGGVIWVRMLVVGRAGVDRGVSSGCEIMQLALVLAGNPCSILCIFTICIH